jgi:hypothetical protein
MTPLLVLNDPPAGQAPEEQRDDLRCQSIAIHEADGGAAAVAAAGPGPIPWAGAYTRPLFSST